MNKEILEKLGAKESKYFPQQNLVVGENTYLMHWKGYDVYFSGGRWDSMHDVSKKDMVLFMVEKRDSKALLFKSMESLEYFSKDILMEAIIKCSNI